MISELTAWPNVEGSRRRQVEYNESDCHKATYNGQSSTCVTMRYIVSCWQRHWQKLIKHNWLQQGKRQSINQSIKTCLGHIAPLCRTWLWRVKNYTIIKLTYRTLRLSRCVYVALLTQFSRFVLNILSTNTRSHHKASRTYSKDDGLFW